MLESGIFLQSQPVESFGICHCALPKLSEVSIYPLDAPVGSRRPVNCHVPDTSSFAPGLAVPIQTFVPLSKIWELPRVSPSGVHLGI